MCVLLLLFYITALDHRSSMPLTALSLSQHPKTMNGRSPRPPTSDSTERQALLHSPSIPNHVRYSNTTHHDNLVFDDLESEVGRRDACRGMTTVAVILISILVSLRYATTWFFQTEGAAPKLISYPDNDGETCPGNIPFCAQPQDMNLVTNGRKGFPSFWDYAPQGPINITYDGRSFLLNGDRALFLSGSIHPNRASKQTWELALDHAVKQGLNMITIYVFWADHQPLPTMEIDWTLPLGKGVACQPDNGKPTPSYCGWSVADAIRAAANRGLFIHARIGPYACGEYNYGGIPEWVPLHKPNMKMRRLNPEWLHAMETYVTSIIQYLTENKLFAYQGGNIVMAQIENELGEEGEASFFDIPQVKDDADGLATSDLDNKTRIALGDKIRSNHVGKATVQDYADWCGSLVKHLAPNVTWTMCNGLSFKDAIITCNGDSCTEWIENHGDTGRILVDQPAMWTEGRCQIMWVAT
jgi:Glycosyl hydrolases family 35